MKIMLTEKQTMRCYKHVQSFLLLFQVLSVDASSAVPLSWWALTGCFPPHSQRWLEWKAAFLWEVMVTKSMQHRNSTLQLVEIDKNWWKHMKTTDFSTKNPWCQSWRVWVFLVMLTTYFVELKTATWDIRISMLEIPGPSHGHIPLLPCPRRVCWLPQLPQMWRKQHFITFSRVNDDVKSSDVIQRAVFWI